MNLLKLITDPFKKKEPPKLEASRESLLANEEEFDKKVSKVFSETKDIRTHKFTEDQKLFIIKLISHGWTMSEVRRELVEEHGIKVSMSTINHYMHSPKWKPIIKKLRDEYISGTMEVAGSHKRVRLERAERVYDRAVAKGDLKNSLASIEHQRKEIEEKKENNSFYILAQQYNFMSDEEVEQRKSMLMDKLKKTKEVQDGKS